MKLFTLLVTSILCTQALAAPQARVEQGILTGKTDNGASAFLGIPYAAPPVDNLRWAPPAPALPYADSSRLAVNFGASCPQTLNPQGFMMWSTEYMSPAEPGVSEDCLFLNIWTPETLETGTPDAALPVLLFIHGGGYTEGSGAVAVYNGANVAKQGIVVVNVNYRLGPLGFLAHEELTAEQGASGNFGIQDLIAALEWIRDNIAAFGGDASQVTIAGQSAGGGAVATLLASPLAKGLFHGAIIQSGLAITRYSGLDSAEQTGAKLMAGLGVKTITEARALSFDTILAGVPRGPGSGGAPIADGHVIPQPGTRVAIVSDVPVMAGYTSDDLFGSRSVDLTAAEWQTEAKERYGDRADEFLRFYPGTTDAQATASAKREATERTMLAPMVDWVVNRAGTTPVYGYVFSHVEPGPMSAQYGAFHTSDVPYLYDTLHLSPGRDFTGIDRQVVQAFSGAMVSFVRTGNPNHAGIPAWPALTQANRALMNFGDLPQQTRIYPAGADDVIRTGKSPSVGGFGPPPEDD